ncbi:MAG: DNA photolyase [Chlamydiia bacterium]|nr:DNA photolyase [Chlamydiia bacterium]
MIQALYIEDAVRNDPFVHTLCTRYATVPQIPCTHFGEVFNRKGQNFRLQKQKPSLILAKKGGKLVLPTPEGYGIGSTNNFYFSHMFNCIFDCRYCFLQGLYQSAHYVVFVNVEDFKQAIVEKLEVANPYFFSGYDCDSLALEPLTHFVETFLPFMAKHPEAHFELRTKSTQIRFLLKHPPLNNCIVAYSLNPETIVKAVEHRTPTFKQRLKALRQLQEAGWLIGLRFDPLIYCTTYRELYPPFFKEIFATLDPRKIHSVTMGTMRFPKPIAKRIGDLYPDSPLIMRPPTEEQNRELFAFCADTVLHSISKEIFFPCENP